MKRITALLAAMCLTATLTACGGRITAPEEESVAPVSSSAANYTIAYAWEMPPPPNTLHPGAR